MIAVVITARASFAKLETVIQHLSDYTLYICGSALLDRYGNLLEIVKRRFPDAPVVPIYSHVDGGLPVSSAKSAGLLTTELAGHFHRDKPSMVVVMADRSEVLAAAQAAAYLNIPVAHIQGGERTGSIDDRCRDAITQLAVYHFPATHLSGLRVYALTGSNRVYVTGCPSIDIAKAAVSEPPVTKKELSGSGSDIDPNGPFVFLLQHSDTDVWEESFQQMTATLNGLSHVNLPIIAQWPNADAGTDRISKALRVWRDRHPEVPLRTVPNYEPTRFLRLVSQTSVLVGNSSAGIRECSWLGVPVVNIGNRQLGRERAGNVADVPYNSEMITGAVKRQVAHGKYPCSTLYGKGDAGEKIAKILKDICWEGLID